MIGSVLSRPPSNKHYIVVGGDNNHVSPAHYVTNVFFFLFNFETRIKTCGSFPGN